MAHTNFLSVRRFFIRKKSNIYSHLKDCFKNHLNVPFETRRIPDKGLQIHNLLCPNACFGFQTTII